MNRDAVPLAQRIAVEQGAMRDLDIRLAQADETVRAATSKGHPKTASELAAIQDKARAQLVTQRQAIAERIAKLKDEQAGIEARKKSKAAKLGPALATARLYGSSDLDGGVRTVCLLLVLAMDPLSLLLVVAASGLRGLAVLGRVSPRPLAVNCGAARGVLDSLDVVDRDNDWVPQECGQADRRGHGTAVAGLSVPID